MQVTCPTCQDKVVWGAQSPYRPFCSKRCQLIDLGEWANEEKAIPAPAGQNEQGLLMADIDVEDIEALLAEQPEDFFKS
ncbi:DNA gyrase inhibitor YacG [Alteromonadaceae bacterium BrNp21-10]|nr:DNA gyrase inhibitor YacG [Alteromonadaceae bacterium BrNp21-10]